MLVPGLIFKKTSASWAKELLWDRYYQFGSLLNRLANLCANYRMGSVVLEPITTPLALTTSAMELVIAHCQALWLDQPQ